jgi:xanthine dehydrogenase molybdenum-binding subunit
METSTRVSSRPRWCLMKTFVTPDTSHQTLETRSAMAYWQNGKVYIHTGTQSTAKPCPRLRDG